MLKVLFGDRVWFRVGLLYDFSHVMALFKVFCVGEGKVDMIML